jgi:proline dehydrogenase
MIRGSLLYLSEQKWLRHWMENSPLSRKLTSRFVAGRTLEEGVQVLRSLARENILGTLDCLGENVSTQQDARHSLDAYLQALDQIAAAAIPSATVSIKLTQFGLDISPELCYQNAAALVALAAKMNTRVEFDMESSAYTDRTIDLVARLQAEFPGHVRSVIQAYLHRSEADIRRLTSLGIPIRLCKGAYREPSTVAFPAKSDVDENYLRLTKLLLSEGVDPAIASHDENIVHATVRHCREQNIAADRFEFQMLYGIRRDLQRELVSQGFRLRLYVPYGDAWYPYFMRRLAERPANLLFLAKNLVRT